MASTLESVVRHYELHLDFVFTEEERADLVAFFKRAVNTIEMARFLLCLYALVYV